MCNTGMRPPEAKNLRWRDITAAKDKDGQDILVIYVRGKGKERKLIAPTSVGTYLDRVRELSKATKPDDPVFTIINGKPAKWLYRDTVEELLKYTDLREGPSGIPRTTYCFRHTYRLRHRRRAVARATLPHDGKSLLSYRHQRRRRSAAPSCFRVKGDPVHAPPPAKWN